MPLVHNQVIGTLKELRGVQTEVLGLGFWAALRGELKLGEKDEREERAESKKKKKCDQDSCDTGRPEKKDNRYIKKNKQHFDNCSNQDVPQPMLTS